MGGAGSVKYRRYVFGSKYYHIFYIVVSTTVTKCFALAFQKGYIDPLIVRKQQCEFAHIKKNNMGIVVSSNSWTRFYI